MWEQKPDPVSELHARVGALEQRLGAVRGVLGLIRPAATLLEHCGVTAGDREAFFRLIDEMTRRAMSGSSISFSEFEERVGALVPGKRDDRRFFEALIEAVKLERPEAKPMLDYVSHAMALYRYRT